MAKSERKYVADGTLLDQYIVATSLSTPVDLWPALPGLGQGMGSFQRIGDSIRNAVCSVKFTFSFQENYTPSGNWRIKIFHGTAKSIKNLALLGNLDAGNLLDKGDGTTTDWVPTATNVVQLSQMPVSNEDYTFQTREFTLVKNNGGLNADATAGAPASANGGFTKTGFSYTWRFAHKGILRYETTQIDPQKFPTNWAPMFGFVAYPIDGYNIVEVAQAPILVTTRQEMYYHDS